MLTHRLEGKGKYDLSLSAGSISVFDRFLFCQDGKKVWGRWKEEGRKIHAYTWHISVFPQVTIKQTEQVRRFSGRKATGEKPPLINMIFFAFFSSILPRPQRVETSYFIYPLPGQGRERAIERTLELSDDFCICLQAVAFAKSRSHTNFLVSRVLFSFCCCCCCCCCCCTNPPEWNNASEG